MNFSINHIKKAFQLARLPEWFSEQVIQYLTEAVRESDTIEAETLNDLFGLFCIKNFVTEDAMKSKSKKENLVRLRKKFAILAKEMFPDYSYPEIGAEINRDHATISHYLGLERTRKEKRDNLERMKNEFRHI
jgi:chromosomal replication initiation ATPase DnaA